MSTTGKVAITEGVKNEAQLVYLHVMIAEEHKVPSYLIFNLDQTLLKCITVGR